MPPIWRKDSSGWQLLSPTGFPDEAALHSLVEQAPEILPLAGSPRLVVVGREVLLGGGYADLIAIEPSGRLVVIEVKLARNAEARRAIIAQVLTYAAYLNGLSVEVLERDVLGRHLRQRGYVDLTDAAARNDQEGSFNAESFQSALSDCLAQGRFRLVLVLDEAPDELVRLVAYLEAVTADRLVIDLIVVSSYRLGDSEIIVPQRVEAERRVIETRAPRTEASGTMVEGVAEFDASIAASRDDQRPALQRLRNWAVSLHDEGLVTLQTYHGKVQSRVSLLPRLPDEGVGLVTIYNNNGNPSLQVFRKGLERRCPAALIELERIIDPEVVGQGTYILNIGDGVLAALTAAYREASGTAGR
jgi:hypothetical protein